MDWMISLGTRLTAAFVSPVNAHSQAFLEGFAATPFKDTMGGAVIGGKVSHAFLRGLFARHNLWQRHSRCYALRDGLWRGRIHGAMSSFETAI